MQVRPGYYWLTTGNRSADGTVLVTVTPFQVHAGKTSDVELVFGGETGTDGGPDSGWNYLEDFKGQPQSLRSVATDRGWC